MALNLLRWDALRSIRAGLKAMVHFISQMPSWVGISTAETGRSDFQSALKTALPQSRTAQTVPPTTPPRADERLDRSIILNHRGTMRCICTSRTKVRHPTLFALCSEHSGLGIYTTQSEAAKSGARH